MKHHFVQRIYTKNYERKNKEITTQSRDLVKFMYRTEDRPGTYLFIHFEKDTFLLYRPDWPSIHDPPASTTKVLVL